MINKEEYGDYLELLLFEDHLEDEKADYLTYHEDLIFRRDSARAVFFKVDEKTDKTFHFPLKDIEKGVYDEVQLNKDKNLVFIKEKENLVVEPVDTPYLVNTLKVLNQGDFDWEVRIKTKSIVKTLLMLHRKLVSKQLDLKMTTISFDFLEKKVSVVFNEEEISYGIECEVLKQGEDKIVNYSYQFFKDFMINSKSFGENVDIFIHQPYFTIIEYNEKVKSVINHKRKTA
jgi:hypothetical protein